MPRNRSKSKREFDRYLWARIAYEGYREHSKGKSLVTGEAIPEFDRLPGTIKDAWRAAAEAIILMRENRRAFHDARTDVKPVVRCPRCDRLDTMTRSGKCSSCNRRANVKRAAEKKRRKEALDGQDADRIVDGLIKERAGNSTTGM